MKKNDAINQAMVLAAGLGTRMQPITITIPKPLVEVDGKTLLDHALDALAADGVTKAVVNVHHLAHQIEVHTCKRKKPSILISDERSELLDSGGGVKKALTQLEQGAFVILNADSFWMDGNRSNLNAMTSFWSSSEMDMLLLLARHEDAVGFDGKGDFFMDETGRLARRGDAESAPLVYAGAIIAKSERFEAIEENSFSLNLLFDQAIAAGRLYGLVLDGLWLHVGTPAAIDEAEQAIATYRATRS